jgi:hypothetical protein
VKACNEDAAQKWWKEELSCAELNGPWVGCTDPLHTLHSYKVLENAVHVPRTWSKAEPYVWRPFCFDVPNANPSQELKSQVSYRCTYMSQAPGNSNWQG